MRPALLINLALVLAIAGSAFGLVAVKHRSRLLFSQTQELVRERDRLNVEWSMLQLEEAAWATHGRVERLAREKLDMRMPRRADIEIIRP